MGGLLGDSWDDPRSMATLQLAQGLLGGGSSMQRLAGGLQGYGAVMGASRKEEEEKKRRALQEQMLMQQLEAARAQQAQQAAAIAKQKAVEDAYRQSIVSPAQQALAGGGGPTPANAAAMQGMAPKLDQATLIRNLMQADPMTAAQMMAPKPRKLTSVSAGASLVDEDTGKSVFTAPKEQNLTSDVQNYEYAKANDGYKGSFTQWKRDNAKAGASNISVGKDDPKLPATVLKQQDDLIDRMTTAKSIESDLAALQKKIETGGLKFGPVTNLVNQGRNMAGISSPESRNFATFKSSLEKLRNDSLRLNTGVQTEGDAQRAWNELFQSINDQDLVKQRLAEIQQINARAAQLQGYRLQVLRDNFGARPLPDTPVLPALALPAKPANRSLDDLLKTYGE